MYAYLDRPVADLEPVDRLLLDGLRHWALAHTLGGDPSSALRRRLPMLAAAGALTPLDAAMATLDRGGTDALEIQRPCFDRVEEAEAVLLAVTAMAHAGGRDSAEAALRHLVSFDSVREIVDALACARRRVAEAAAREPRLQ